MGVCVFSCGFHLLSGAQPNPAGKELGRQVGPLRPLVATIARQPGPRSWWRSEYEPF